MAENILNLMQHCSQVPSHVLVEILERCVDSLKSMGSNDDIVLDLERQLNDFIKTLRHMIDNKLENKETVGVSGITPPPKDSSLWAGPRYGMANMGAAQESHSFCLGCEATSNQTVFEGRAPVPNRGFRIGKMMANIGAAEWPNSSFLS
jgi:hypothetical protein